MKLSVSTLLALCLMSTCVFAYNNYTRTKRQARPYICAPAYTCIVQGGSIDPRIVSPTGSPPTMAPPTPAPTSSPPATCPEGTVRCYLVETGAACGTRYITNANTQPGYSVYGAFPWQAYIRNQSGYIGSGVLVDSFSVLTAAHKVYDNRFTPTNVLVNIGVWNPSVDLSQSQARTASAIRIHPDYDPATLINDIAVMRLNAPISLGYQINVGSACLPAAGNNYVGQTCGVSGWGRTGFNINDAPTNPQKQVFVPIVDLDTCLASMEQANVLGSNAYVYLDENELCAGGTVNNDACTLDGGAPLMCQAGNLLYVVGLVIWGKGCGQAGVYGVYVDVVKYRSWIDQSISELAFG